MNLWKTHDYGTPIIKTISNWVCLVATVAPIIYMITMWGEIPTEIPTHFNAAGIADGYGSKNTLIFLAVVMVLMYVGLTIAAAFPQFWNIGSITDKNSPRVRMKVNFMVKNTPDYTDEEINRAYNLMANMLSWVNLIVICMFSYTTIKSIRCENLGAGFLFISVGGMIGVMVYYMFKIYKRNPHKMKDE